LLRATLAEWFAHEYS